MAIREPGTAKCYLVFFEECGTLALASAPAMVSTAFEGEI